MKIDKIKKDKMVMLELFYIFDIDLLLKFILNVRYFYLNKIFVGGIDLKVYILNENGECLEIF